LVVVFGCRDAIVVGLVVSWLTGGRRPSSSWVHPTHREAEAKGGSKEERGAAQGEMARSTSLEALSYALFVVNGLYLVGAPLRCFVSDPPLRARAAALPPSFFFFFFFGG